MKRTMPSASKLSVIGLIVLAVLALGLSAAALLQHRGGTAVPEQFPVSTPEQSPDSSPESTTEQSPETSEPESPEESTPPEETETSEPEGSASPSETPEGAPTVVVIGDTNSLGDEDALWVDMAAEELGWGNVVNLSSEGRGYTAAPRSCDFEPCDNLLGSVDLIADEDPDLVITFAGTADGDVSLQESAATYFSDLREALPEAELVAISPVTGADEWPYYLTMHEGTIRSGVEAVDGTMIDVGRIGVGEETLSEDSHQEIADFVVDALG